MRWGTKEPSRAWCCTPRRNSALALALVAVGAALLAATVFRPASPRGPVARDFEAYYAAGATWNAGGNPWSRDVWRIERTIPGVDVSHDELLPFAGPAAGLPLWSLFARLPYALAATLWTLVLTVALAALLLAALALSGATIGPVDASIALLLGAVSGPAIGALALGQAALVAAAAVALALLAFERRARWGIAAAFVASLQPNLALPLAVELVHRRAALQLAGAALGFLLVTGLAGGGVRGVAGYLQILTAHATAERGIAIQYTIPAIAASFGAARAGTLLGALCSVAAFALAGVAALRFRSQPLIAACVAVALLPFAVPFFHEHDFVLELLPAIALGVSVGTLRAATGIAAVCIMVDWFGVAQRPATAGQTLCLALSFGCAYALLVLRRGAGKEAFAPVVAALLLAATALPLALAFPAPVWPDALGAYQAPPDAAAGAVWAAEQLRSGLGASVPAWGLLRAVPLAGCLGLAVIAALTGAARARAATPVRAYTATYSKTAS